MGKTVQGRVKWFKSGKGYGFIAGEDGVDYFVHYSSIESEEKYKTLDDGAKVSFTPSEGDRGPVAKNVKVLKIE